jgi:NADPH:quinone reductase-like Zn-dependent oxidoreductase
MAVPDKMMALVQTSDGFSADVPAWPPSSLDAYLALRTIPTPTPRSGQVLIKVRLSAVNPSDIAFVQGAYATPRVEGTPAGFEAVGDVVASGGGLMARTLVGRRVSFFAGISGSWAEYAVAQAAICIPLPKSIADDEGATLIVNPAAVWLLADMARRSKSRAFVMTAAGSQFCKLLTVLAAEQGGRPISLVRRADQIEPLKRLGAAHVLDTSAPDFADNLRRVFEAEAPLLLFDALASPLSASVLTAMPRKSRWIMYGGLAAGGVVPLPDPRQFIADDKKIEGFLLSNWAAETPFLSRLRVLMGVRSRFASGKWRTDVAERVPLRDALTRLPALLAAPNSGKVLLQP